MLKALQDSDPSCVALGLHEAAAGALLGTTRDAIEALERAVASHPVVLVDSLMPFTIDLPGGYLRQGFPRGLVPFLVALDGLAAAHNCALIAAYNPLVPLGTGEDVLTVLTPITSAVDAFAVRATTSSRTPGGVRLTTRFAWYGRMADRSGLSFNLQTEISHV